MEFPLASVGFSIPMVPFLVLVTLGFVALGFVIRRTLPGLNPPLSNTPARAHADDLEGRVRLVLSLSVYLTIYLIADFVCHRSPFVVSSLSLTIGVFVGYYVARILRKRLLWAFKSVG